VFPGLLPTPFDFPLTPLGRPFFFFFGSRSNPTPRFDLCRRCSVPFPLAFSGCFYVSSHKNCCELSSCFIAWPGSHPPGKPFCACPPPEPQPSSVWCLSLLRVLFLGVARLLETTPPPRMSTLVWPFFLFFRVCMDLQHFLKHPFSFFFLRQPP